MNVVHGFFNELSIINRREKHLLIKRIQLLYLIFSVNVMRNIGKITYLINKVLCYLWKELIILMERINADDFAVVLKLYSIWFVSLIFEK
jgi:hypothetical protein